METIKMTPEIQRQLAGLLPMDNTTGYTFTPDMFDKVPEDYQPTFTIKQLPNDSILLVKGIMLKEAADQEKVYNTKKKLDNALDKMKRNNDTYTKLIHEALIEWSKLYILGTDTTIEYDGTIESLQRLPEVLQTSILSEIIKISGFMPQG